MSKRDNNKDLLMVSEVAEIFRVDSTTVRRWAKQGILETVALPHNGGRVSYRVKRTTVNALLSPPTKEENHV